MPRLHAMVVTLALGASCGRGAGDLAPSAAETDDAVDEPQPSPEPTLLGRAHRLSANELRLSAQEVFGVDLPTLSFLPAVNPALGYEHLDEVQVDDAAWLDALELWARQVLATRRTSAPLSASVVRWRGPDLDWDAGGNALISDASFSVLHASSSAMQATFEVPTSGLHDVSLVTVLAWRRASVSVDVYLDGAWWGRANSPVADVPGHAFVPITGTADLSAGPHQLRLVPSFNRTLELEVPPPPAMLEDEGPWIAFDWMELTPHDAAPAPAPLGPAVRCPSDDRGCVRAALADLGAALWRRPLTASDLDAALAVVDAGLAEGLPVEDATDEALVGLMLAPDFGWLPGPGALETDAEDRDLRPWRAASRLSYALWQAPPDAALRACAASGGLTRGDAGPCGWAAQRDRLLADPRSDALVTELVERWLGVHDVARLDFITRDYPLWNLDLVADLEEELRETVRAARRDRTPLTAWLQGTTSHASGRAARYYGAPTGSLLTPHDFDRGADRPGLLGLGLVAMARARGTEPTAVDPAIWVLERLLCRELPSPPANVPPLPPGLDPVASLAQHAADPACAVCHESLDPYGAPLLGFDAIGAAREVSSRPVTLPEGVTITSVAEYASFLSALPEYTTCAARRISAWVWRHEPGPEDEAHLTRVRDAALAEGGHLDAWVRAALDADPELAGAAP